MRKYKVFMINLFHYFINKINRIRLSNLTPTLIVSNCTGGFLYHWLGLKFYSPFINLWMTNEDFIIALENFENFINTPLSQCQNSGVNYPVGVGYLDTKIYFQHYKTWEEAIDKWEKRKKRINPNNLGIILSNFKGIDAKSKWSDEELIDRFNQLKFKHKIIFVDRVLSQCPNCVYIKNWLPEKGMSVFDWNEKDFYRRYIDQFDYVKFINNLKEIV